MKKIISVLSLFILIICVGFGATSSVLMGAVALNELAEKELIKHFRHENTWMQVVPSKNQWVNNDVIKLTEIGADPNVLINNNTYPIATSSRVDDSVAISLYKFDTENTKITDDELNALPYDKPGSVQEQHREALEEKTAEMALHSLSPVEDDAVAKTFVIETTGSDDGNGRKMLKSRDLIKLKKLWDDNKIPKNGRVLILCSEHVSDLLIEDLAFERRYQNHENGVITKNYYGFTVYESAHNAIYNASNVKKAFGAVSDPTDRNASVAFYAPNTAQARGSVKRYLSEADVNPEMRESKVGFRLYHIAIPTKKVGMSAIVSVPA